MESTNAILGALQDLGWIDITAISVLGVFFILGIFKGLVWQVSRVAILLIAYWGATQFGPDLADVLASLRQDSSATADYTRPEAWYLYCAWLMIFVAVLVVLSILALLLHNVIHKAGLGFYNRLFGGVLGMATGAVVVLVGMMGVHMLFPESSLAAATNDSYSLKLSREVIDQLEPMLPDELSTLLPHDAGSTAGTEGTPGESTANPGQAEPVEATTRPGEAPAGG
jgi:membrane protein required for colicin V production